MNQMFESGNSATREARLVVTQFDNSTIRDRRRITRRRFLGRTVALSGVIAAPWVMPSWARGADESTVPSERITMGLIGKGCMGSGRLNRLLFRAMPSPWRI